MGRSPPKIKKAFPKNVLVASIMAGSGNDKELNNWQLLAKTCQDEGVDALELNFSCPHMDRDDMGSNIGKSSGLTSIVTKAVKEVAKVPVWTKLTPSTTDIAVEAGAAFRGGADAITSSNTFPSIPLVDPETLDFEMNVDGYTSSGGLGGPAILPLALAKMAQMTRAFPDKSFSGIGGISDFSHALNYFLLGLRHRAGVHGRDAGPRDRPERDQDAQAGDGRVPREERRQGMALAGGLPRPEARPRRAAVTDPPSEPRRVPRRSRGRGLRGAGSDARSGRGRRKKITCA